MRVQDRAPGTSVLRDAGRTLTIQRTETGWGLAEYENYPVPTDKVRENVDRLSDSIKAQPLTAVGVAALVGFLFAGLVRR